MKALLINSSPNTKSSTFTVLSIMMEELHRVDKLIKRQLIVKKYLQKYIKKTSCLCLKTTYVIPPLWETTNL